MNISIERMLPEDTRDVADIERSCFSRPWSEAAFSDAIKKDCYLFYVAKCDGKIVGNAGLIISMDEADVTNVAVKEAFRRQGIAYKLLYKLINDASEQGIKAFTLEVREHNTAAISLYERLGFVCEGKRPHFYDDPDEDALIYWKRKGDSYA